MDQQNAMYMHNIIILNKRNEVLIYATMQLKLKISMLSYKSIQNTYCGQGEWKRRWDQIGKRSNTVNILYENDFESIADAS